MKLQYTRQSRESVITLNVTGKLPVVFKISDDSIQINEINLSTDEMENLLDLLGDVMSRRDLMSMGL